MGQRHHPDTRQVCLPDGTAGPDRIHLHNGTRRRSALCVPMSSIQGIAVLSAPTYATLCPRRHALRSSLHSAAILRVRRRAVGRDADQRSPQQHYCRVDDDDGQRSADQLEHRSDQFVKKPHLQGRLFQPTTSTYRRRFSQAAAEFSNFEVYQFYAQIKGIKLSALFAILTWLILRRYFINAVFTVQTSIITDYQTVTISSGVTLRKYSLSCIARTHSVHGTEFHKVQACNICQHKKIGQ